MALNTIKRMQKKTNYIISGLKRGGGGGEAPGGSRFE